MLFAMFAAVRFQVFLSKVSQKTTKIHHRTRGLEIKNTQTSPEVLTHEDSTKSPKETPWKFQKELYMGVSKNMGAPQIIHSNRVFHYKPFILGFPYFWKHPYTTSPPKENACTYLNPPLLEPSGSQSVYQGAAGLFCLWGGGTRCNKDIGGFMDLGSMDSHM